jgi:hypothetical protein
MATARDIITQALQEIGTLQAGEVPNAGDAVYSLGKLNGLLAEQRLNTFATLDTASTFPTDYQQAIMLTLSEGLCGPFGKKISPELAEMARRARAAIEARNSHPPALATRDSGIPGRRGAFDILTGQFT